MGIRAKRDELNLAIAAWDKPPRLHNAKLSEKWTGMPCFDGNTPKMAEEEKIDAMKWINEHFLFLEQRGGESATIDSILDRDKQAEWHRPTHWPPCHGRNWAILLRRDFEGWPVFIYHNWANISRDRNHRFWQMRIHWTLYSQTSQTWWEEICYYLFRTPSSSTYCQAVLE